MKPRRSLLATAVIVVVTALSTTACTGDKNAVDQSAGGQFRYVSGTGKGKLIEAAKRKSAGNVTGDLLDGGQYQLASDKGKVTVLNYFASWCGPCQVETPQLDQIYQARKAKGLAMVGFDVKDASKSASKSWLQTKGITFPVVYDEPAKTALQLGDVPIASLPATILIDKQGRVAAVYPIVVAPADLDPVLDTLLNES